MVYNENQLRKLLELIKKDPKKVVSCQHFFEGQWIQYNQEKGWYEYEDKSFLGIFPDHVIEFLNGLGEDLGQWLRDANWFIKEKN